MNSVIETLEKRYKSFIDETETRSFFVGLADYVRYIENTPDLYKILKLEEKEREKLLKQRDELDKALKELGMGRKELFGIIKKKKVLNKELKQVIEDFKQFEEGKIRSSGTIAENIERYLWNIGKILYGLGYKKELKKFINVDGRDNRNTYFDNQRFTLSKSLLFEADQRSQRQVFRNFTRSPASRIRQIRQTKKQPT